MKGTRKGAATKQSARPSSVGGSDSQGDALPESAISAHELPRDWRWVRVRDIGEVQLGRQRAPKHQNGANMRPYLRVANVFEDRIDLSDVLTMNFTPREFETFALRANDILLNEGQSLHLVGRPALYRDDLPGACFQNTLVRFRPGPQVDPKFALTIFRGYLHTGKFQKIARWTTNIAHLGAQRFSEMPFPLPPLPEQRRIVAEIEKQFTRLEAGVAALRRAQANLKRYRASVLKAACEGRLVPTEAELAKANNTTFESGEALLARILTERLKNWQGRGQYEEPPMLDSAHLPPVPMGWSWTTIGALIREPLRNGHSAKATGTGRGLRVFTLSAVTEGDFSDRNTKLSAAVPEKVADLWAEPGDIYVERSNTPELVGTARLYKGPSRFAFIPDLLIRVRLASLVASSYIEMCLQSERGRSFFRSKAQGISGTMPKIDQETVELTPIPLPPLAEQTRIVAEVERRLSVIDELESLVSANLQRSTRLRQSILQKAFTGELA